MESSHSLVLCHDLKWWSAQTQLIYIRLYLRARRPFRMCAHVCDVNTQMQCLSAVSLSQLIATYH